MDDLFAFINQETARYLEDNDLNFCKYFPPKKGGKMSVIGKYLPCGEDKEYVTLDRNLNTIISTDLSSYYYGVSPLIDGKRIVNAVASLALSNEEKLDAFIAQYNSCFMLRKGQKKFLLDMARYFVIAVAYNYGIKIVFQEEEALDRLKKSSDMDDKFLLCQNGELSVHGCPSERTIALLNEYKYTEVDGRYVASRKGEWSIFELYKQENAVRLLTGDIFYSGALLRALKIEELQSYYGNKDVIPLRICFERSSFGTVYALDNNFISHPLLKNSKENVVAFFHTDDRKKREYLLSKADTREELLGNINAYLQESYNVNQIGVSGNIQTKDNFLVYGKRAAKAIDAGKLYPSVNGNAEVVDENVGFYRLSANVDFPYIKTDGLRIDFCSELNREAEAELNLHLNENLWVSNGLILSGIIPSEPQTLEEYAERQRRMHINLLFEQTIPQTFFEVKRQAKIALEAYENKDLFGLQINVHKNKIAGFFSAVKNILQSLMKSKNMITSLFTILLFFGSVSTLREYSLKNVSSMISFLFAGLMIVITLINMIEGIKKYREKRKFTQKMCFIKNKQVRKQIGKKLRSFLKKYKYHPVFCVSLLCYITRKL